MHYFPYANYVLQDMFLLCNFAASSNVERQALKTKITCNKQLSFLLHNEGQKVEEAADEYSF